MQAQKVTEDYIANIPWEKNPAFCFADGSDIYAEAFKNVIEFVPQVEDRIKFEDDTWDFRQLYADINSDSYNIRFNKAGNDYKEYLKFFAIYGISRKSKISTIHLKISDFIRLINDVKSHTNHDSFSLITSDDIITLIENKNVTNGRKSVLYSNTHVIYEFIIKNYNLKYAVDINALKERSAYYKKAAKQYDDKIPNIPEEYYVDIVNKAIEVLNDESECLNTRMTAGMIILASQTGLRVQDLLGIKVDDLSKRYLPISKVTCHYLHFQTRKPSKAHSDMLEFDIFASELFVEAFNKLCEIRKQCEFSNEPYLYVIDPSRNSTNTYPITEARFYREYQRFYFNHMNYDAKKSWEGITPTRYMMKNVPFKINIPKLSQFRVHLATALYNNGVSLVYIQRYLGHLSEYMLGYYVRPKDNSQENADYAERIVKKIVCDDGTPIGLMGKELKDNLIAFIKKGNYNVATDTQQILDDLGENLVIREKGPGLCCVKTSIIPCKHDARTNATLCAYGLCPNIFHFYDAVDVSYQTLHDLEQSYALNLDRGFTRAAEKELRKLKDFIERRFKPELNELNRLVNKHGLEAFCLEHPDLRNVATNINDIYKEVELWENY